MFTRRAMKFTIEAINESGQKVIVLFRLLRFISKRILSWTHNYLLILFFNTNSHFESEMLMLNVTKAYAMHVLYLMELNCLIK